MKRFAAALLSAVVMGGAVPVAASLRCGFDGVARRSACCCGVSCTQAVPATDAIAARRCCDVVSSQPVQTPARSDARAPELRAPMLSAPVAARTPTDLRDLRVGTPTPTRHCQAPPAYLLYGSLRI